MDAQLLGGKLIPPRRLEEHDVRRQAEHSSGEYRVLWPTTSYLLCSTPRTGSSLLCDALRAHRRRRPARGVLPVPGPHGPAAPAARVLRGRRETPRSSRSSGRARATRRTRSATTRPAFAATRTTSPGPSSKATTPNGVLGAKVMWGYFNGFVTGLRWAVPGPPEAPGLRARAVGLPEPALRLRDPPRQGASGGLAVEGDPDLEHWSTRAARRRTGRWSTARDDGDRPA